LQELNLEEKISSTVSVWHPGDALTDYTFTTFHGDYLKRKGISSKRSRAHN